jgi:hypothetical protein
MDVYWKPGQIEDALAWKFRNGYKNGDIALTGILLARPEDSLARDEILPNLSYWNRRSAEHVDFFCVGYLPRWYADSTAGLPRVVTVGNGEWAFALDAFMELLSAVERSAGVVYDGSPHLLLLNCYFDRTTERARLDYSRVVWINLRKAIGDDAVATPTELAEHVFEFAKQANAKAPVDGPADPIWEFSGGMGRRILKRSALDALLSFLPEALRPNARRAFHFAVKEN